MDEPAAYTITSFCKAHNYSRSFYYKLKSENKGPKEMRPGPRISREAAAEHRREREAEAAAEAAKTAEA